MNEYQSSELLIEAEAAGKLSNQTWTTNLIVSYLVFDCYITLFSLFSHFIILSVHCMQGSIENQCTTELDYPG